MSRKHLASSPDIGIEQGFIEKITNHAQSPITTHQSPITNHQSPLTMYIQPQKPTPLLVKKPTLVKPNRFVRAAAKLILDLFGWQIEGELPEVSKYVVIAAPHTSNWDLPVMLLYAAYFGIKPYWMVKDTLMRWPIAGIARWLGAVPINRRSPHNMVDQMIELFNQYDPFVIAIPPEGTRKRKERWKTGFYYIAVGAKVPIVFGYLDFGRQMGGIGGVFMPTGDFEADIRVIADFYDQKIGKFPHEQSPVLPKRSDKVKG